MNAQNDGSEEQELRNDPTLKATYQGQDVAEKALFGDGEERRALEGVDKNRWWLGFMTLCIACSIEELGFKETHALLAVILSERRMLDLNQTRKDVS